MTRVLTIDVKIDACWYCPRFNSGAVLSCKDIPGSERQLDDVLADGIRGLWGIIFEDCPLPEKPVVSDTI